LWGGGWIWGDEITLSQFKQYVWDGNINKEVKPLTVDNLVEGEVFKEENKTSKYPSIGTKVKLLKGVYGCKGVDGQVGYVTNNKAAYGLIAEKTGFNVKLDNEKTWRYDGTYEILPDKESPKKYNIIDANTIVTRAVKENNPKILEESGLTLEEISSSLKDNCCMRGNITIIMGCEGLTCNSDNCPFSVNNNKTIETAREWLFSKSKSYSFEDNLRAIIRKKKIIVSKTHSNPIIIEAPKRINKVIIKKRKVI